MIYSCGGKCVRQFICGITSKTLVVVIGQQKLRIERATTADLKAMERRAFSKKNREIQSQ